MTRRRNPDRINMVLRFGIVIISSLAITTEANKGFLSNGNKGFLHHMAPEHKTVYGIPRTLRQPQKGDVMNVHSQNSMTSHLVPITLDQRIIKVGKGSKHSQKNQDHVPRDRVSGLSYDHIQGSLLKGWSANSHRMEESQHWGGETLHQRGQAYNYNVHDIGSQHPKIDQKVHKKEPIADTTFSFHRQVQKLSKKSNHSGLRWSKGNGLGHDVKPKPTPRPRILLEIVENKNQKLPAQAKSIVKRIGSNKIGTLPRVPGVVNYAIINRRSRPQSPLQTKASVPGSIGVTKTPILTATMLGMDKNHTTDIPEELEINGVSYDSPHDMNGKPHPLSPGYGQPAANPPPPPQLHPSNQGGASGLPPPPSVTRRPILTATMLGMDVKNSTDIPEELEINGTSYDSPHDMNGMPHPLDPGGSYYNHVAKPHFSQPAARHPVVYEPPPETTTVLYINFANPTPPPPFFSDAFGMTTVPPYWRRARPPPLHAIVPAKNSVKATALPTYRTVPATYAPSTNRPNYRTVPPTYAPPPPPSLHNNVYTVPPTYAPPQPKPLNNNKVYTVPPTYAPHSPPKSLHKNHLTLEQPEPITKYQPSVDKLSPQPSVPQNTDIMTGLNVALGANSDNTKFVKTIDAAMSGQVKSGIDKALTSQMLDALDSIITAKIESLMKETTKTKVASQPSKAAKKGMTSDRSYFGLRIESVPYRLSDISADRNKKSSNSRPRNRLHH